MCSDPCRSPQPKPKHATMKLMTIYGESYSSPSNEKPPKSFLSEKKTSSMPNSAHFNTLISTPNIIVTDKIKYIEELNQEPQYQCVLPQLRCWRKSTFLRMLSANYNKTKKAMFNDMFEKLYIGQHLTNDHNFLPVLVRNFSSIWTLHLTIITWCAWHLSNFWKPMWCFGAILTHKNTSSRKYEMEVHKYIITTIALLEEWM